MVLDLDVVAVQGDVATDELDAFDPMVPGELLGLVADLAPELPVLVVLPHVFRRDDPEYVVGLRVRFAAPRRQRDAPDELPDLGRDDYLVADPEVEVPGVAEPRRAPAGDADVHEPGERPSILCRVRDNATSRIASGETLYARAARASPKLRAAPAQSAPDAPRRCDVSPRSCPRWRRARASRLRWPPRLCRRARAVPGPPVPRRPGPPARRASPPPWPADPVSEEGLRLSRLQPRTPPGTPPLWRRPRPPPATLSRRQFGPAPRSPRRG